MVIVIPIFTICLSLFAADAAEVEGLVPIRQAFLSSFGESEQVCICILMESVSL